MRKLHALIFLCVCVIPFGVQGQSYFTSAEIGISLGGSQYFGDLNENYGFKTISPAAGIYVRRRMNGYISLKVLANYTKVSYDDKFSTDYYDRSRNLNFTSNIIEAAFQAEFNFFKFVTGDPYNRWTPYLTGGIGAFYYDPYTTYQGTRYFLRPLGTEGQNEHMGQKYGNISPCFPIGVGFKVWLKAGMNLTIEFADRLTLTDHLDDVSGTYAGAAKFTESTPAYALQDRSIELNTTTTPLGRPGKQRGNTASKDQYLMGQISLSWHFTTYRCPHQNEELIRVR